jgi:hypothetical protein
LHRRSLFRRLPGTIDPHIVASVIVKKGSACMRDRRVSQREFRIQGNRLLEHLSRKLEILFRHATNITLAAQVKVVRLKIIGRLSGDLCLFLRRKSDAERFRNFPRDLVLQLKDVLHLAVITL